MKFIYTIIALVWTVVSLQAQIFNGNTNNGEHFKYNQTISIGSNSDRFGYQLDENDGLLISGNSYATVNGNLKDGNANIYQFDTLSNEWELKQQLIPWGYTNSGGEFGTAVGLNDDYAFVGAFRGYDTLDIRIYGIVYIFKNENGTFVPHQRILGNIDNNARLGRKIEVSDSTVALFSGDSMNIYGLNEETGFWEKEYGTSEFLSSVEVDNDQFFAAKGDSLFVFEKQSNEWTIKQSVLIKPAGVETPFYSVRYSDNHLAVALTVDHDSLGTIYIYEKDAQDNWSLFTEIVDQNIYYGLQIDLDEDYLVFVTEPYEQRMLSGHYLNKNGLIIYKRESTTYNYHQHVIMEDEDWQTMYRVALSKVGLVCSNSSTWNSEIYSFPKLNVDNWEYKSIKCEAIEFGGEQITTAGSYFDTLISDRDTSINALFVIDPPTEKYTSSIISTTPYEYNGIIYDESTTIVDTYTNVFGCDSIIELELFIVGSERLSTCSEVNEFQAGYYEVIQGEDGWGKFKATEAGKLTITSCAFTEEDTYLVFNSDCSTEIAESDDDCGEAASELTYSMLAGDSILFGWLDLYGHNEFIYEIKFEADSVVTSINDYEMELTSVYPNPTSGELSLVGFSTDKEVKVVNLQGEIMFTQLINGGIINLSKLNDGIYFLKQGQINIQIAKQ